VRTQSPGFMELILNWIFEGCAEELSEELPLVDPLVFSSSLSAYSSGTVVAADVRG